MSIEQHLYTRKIDDSIIPKWMERMNQFDMECEIHPEFSFSDQSGFLPFKIKLKQSSHPELTADYYLTGFELYMDDFKLETELEKLRPKQGLLGKVFGNKSSEVYYVNPEIDEKLKDCKKITRFSWSTADTFELRMAYLSSAVLSELLDGVSCYPADDIWYDNSCIVRDALKEITDYEASLKPREFSLHKYEDWH